MNTLDELRIKSEELKKMIKEKVVSTNPDLLPITDGIIDVEKYYHSKYKILWILKEPYDYFNEEGEPAGGDWGLDDVIRQKQSFNEFEGGRKTYLPMIYTSWGILNDFCLWDEMSNVYSDLYMIDAIKSVAYINVKKLPGHTTSQPKVIENIYTVNKSILLKQIECFNPDIVIGGSTLYLFFNDLGLINTDFQSLGSVEYTIKRNRIYICAYHPSNRLVKQKNYCDDIIKAVKIWANDR